MKGAVYDSTLKYNEAGFVCVYSHKEWKHHKVVSYLIVSCFMTLSVT